ncbi:amidase [Rugosimonospora africana]|uniref:Amidase n=1 Tax=Rugosimonospora africana TaxID=556532 RepID=A0A8J3QR42_9ACTN|nr:amidase [Rugosimonospora africana]GIH14792.1 amidase [Rugosimonospora africana]
MTDPSGGDLTRLTLNEASAAVTGGQLSPVELTEAYLDRIAAVDPAINAYTTVVADAARRDARAAEHDIAHGRHRGPLHGLPVGLKDLFDTAGVRTTAGSALRRDHVPATDSAVAARLREAGAVLLGKHATHEFAWGGTTTNPHFGPTRNPWDLDRIPGGSSGGSAASLVARTALASVGTDTCGSVRIPAALCGCVGLKPTYGLIDLTGAVPLAPSLDHAGPLARTVADTALLFDVLSGAAGRAGSAGEAGVGTRAGLGRDEEGDLTGLRVGWLGGWFSDVLDAEVAGVVARCAGRLADRGAVVENLDAPDFGPVTDRVFDIVLAEAEPYHRAAFRGYPEMFGPDLRANLSLTPPTAAELAAGRPVLDRLTRWLDAALRRVDVLLAATEPLPAPPIGAGRVDVGDRDLHIEWALTRLTSVFNVARLPALSVPGGLSAGELSAGGLSAGGLPIGVQLVGRPLREVDVLRAGRAAEVSLGDPPLLGR